jgi:hypothetical protein
MHSSYLATILATPVNSGVIAMKKHAYASTITAFALLLRISMPLLIFGIAAFAAYAKSKR